jgi:hypothetical protein
MTQSKVAGQDGYYGQCMICDHFFTKEEFDRPDSKVCGHYGHPDSCFDVNGNGRSPEEQMIAQDRAHVGWIKRNGKSCDCTTCVEARKVE